MSASLYQEARALLADQPADATAAEIAATCAARLRATVFALRHDAANGGDIAFDGPAGGFGADRWGEGAARPGKAGREVGARPGCLIGLSYRGERVVIDPETRQVRPEIQVTVIASATPQPRQTALKRAKAVEAPTPQPLSVADASAAVTAASAERLRLESDAISRRAALAGLQRRKTEAERRRERAHKAIGNAAVSAVTKGEAIQDMPRLRDAVVRADAEVAACDAARPVAQDAAKVAEVALREHGRTVALAALDLDAALTAAALPAATKAIGSLHQALAELAAVSVVRERLLGPRFQFHPSRHAKPIGARQVVAAFIDSIPAPLRPESLTIEAIEARATEIAERRLAQLQPHQSEN